MRTGRLWEALRTPSGVVAILLLVFLAFLVVAAPSIWGAGAANTNVVIANHGPSMSHWLGTDALGRDVLDRILVATRSSLVLAVLATAVGGALGVSLGVLSAVTGRLGGRLLGGLINLLLAFPALLLAIFFAVIFGLGSTASVFAVGASFAPGFARLTQTLAASIADRDYMKASRMLGRGRFFVVRRHMLPNVSEPLLLYGTIHVGTAILTLAGLSFLGLGVQPPSYDWGGLLSIGLSQIYLTPAQAIGPAAAIVVAGVACNLAGEVLAEALGGRGRLRRMTRSALRLAGAAAAGPAAPGRPVSAATAGGGAAMGGAAGGAAAGGAAASDGTASGGTAGGAAAGGGALLEVEQLSVELPSPAGIVRPVREVTFALRPEERVGIVGESGSGKSLMALAIARLLGPEATTRAGRLRFCGEDLLRPSPSSARLLGRNMALVFQDPGETLNPALKIQTHLREPAEVHLGLDKRSALVRAAASLRAVAIPDVARRLRQHQHELSGGMKQRVSIAVALTAEPRLLIADEPTTALDVSVQRQILRLLVRLGKRERSALILISHDIAVVSEICDRVLVMYAGFIVEDAPVAQLLAAPAHPYSAILLAASPDMGIDRERPLPTLDGRVPGPEVELPGCYFAQRCPFADDRCRVVRPPLEELAGGRRVACWHPHGATATPTAAPAASHEDGDRAMVTS